MSRSSNAFLLVLLLAFVTHPVESQLCSSSTCPNNEPCLHNINTDRNECAEEGQTYGTCCYGDCAISPGCTTPYLPTRNISKCCSGIAIAYELHFVCVSASYCPLGPLCNTFTVMKCPSSRYTCERSVTYNRYECVDVTDSRFDGMIYGFRGYHDESNKDESKKDQSNKDQNCAAIGSFASSPTGCCSGFALVDGGRYICTIQYQ